MMSLKMLLEELQPGTSKIPISKITHDSRQVQPGSLFVALAGNQHQGTSFIPQAIAKGAVAVLVDRTLALEIPKEYKHTCYLVTDLPQQLSVIAARFYQQPSKQMYITGVTGTNGKTTVSYLLAKALTLLQAKSAYLGTLGLITDSIEHASSLTTPDAITTQAYLAKLLAKGIDNLTMEVSSIGLASGRVKAVDFNAAIFTNLTQDHLDYHGNMANYQLAKSKLFLDYNLQQAIINLDSPMGSWLVNQLDSKHVTTFSSKQVATIELLQVDREQSQQRLKIATPTGNCQFTTSLLGDFNLENLLAITGALHVQGYSNEQIAITLAQLPDVPGRMQWLAVAGKPRVVVDYAHTPAALQQVLQTLNQLTQGRLHCVIGCGGNRQQSKRAQMGAIAAELADFVYLTDDNPRFEQSMDIIEDMLEGMPTRKTTAVIPKRQAAIREAIVQAGPKDVVLIAGKGHENYQIYQDHKITFDDFAVASAIIEGL